MTGTNDAPPRVVVVINGSASSERPSGAQMRRAFLVRSATMLGPTSVFVTTSLSPSQRASMEAEFGVRVSCLAVEQRRPPSVWHHFARVLLPRVVAIDDRHGQRQEFASLLSDGAPALTVVHHIDNFLLLRPLLMAPLVVDVDDVESRFAVQRVRNLWARQMRVDDRGSAARLPRFLRVPLVSLRRTPRFLSRSIPALLELVAWRRGERLALREAQLVTVCSADDQRALGPSSKLLVVPNGFDLRSDPARALDAPASHTIAFWGSMLYPPNTDGARWFVRDILPLLRSAVPHVQVRLIGRGSERLGLASPPTVVATGPVEDMSHELSGVDVAIVPLRMGAGTRIKIIEAWANHIPVVSTTTGAHGLGARHGVDALIADKPAEFAAAIVRALADRDLRQRLVGEGGRRARDLTWSRSTEQLVTALRSLLG